MKLPPEPVKSSSTANEAFSSAVQPKTLPPRQTGETLRPLRPSSRNSMLGSWVRGVIGNEQQQAGEMRSREVLGTLRSARCSTGMGGTNPEILIVGAGPTGLTAALELARRGHRPRIIDRDGGPTPLSKAVGIAAHTLDLLEPSGVADRLIAAGIRIERGYVWYKNRRIGTIDFTSLPHRYNFLLSLPQSETERIMSAALAEQGIAVEWQTALTGVSPNGAGIDVMLGSGNGHARPVEELHFDYVYGADGAHSAVRAGVRIPF